MTCSDPVTLFHIITRKCYNCVTEILKVYYKYAKRIEKSTLKVYNNLALMIKQKVQKYY